jgi:hypothetical protein
LGQVPADKSAGRRPRSADPTATLTPPIPAPNLALVSGPRSTPTRHGDSAPCGGRTALTKLAAARATTLTSTRRPRARRRLASEAGPGGRNAGDPMRGRASLSRRLTLNQPRSSSGRHAYAHPKPAPDLAWSAGQDDVDKSARDPVEWTRRTDQPRSSSDCHAHIHLNPAPEEGLVSAEGLRGHGAGDPVARTCRTDQPHSGSGWPAHANPNRAHEVGLVSGEGPRRRGCEAIPCGWWSVDKSRRRSEDSITMSSWQMWVRCSVDMAEVRLLPSSAL